MTSEGREPGVVNPQGVRLDDLRRGHFHGRLATVAQELFDDAGDDDYETFCAVIVVSGLACDAAAGCVLGWFLEIDARRPEPRLSPGQTRRLRELLRSKKSVNLKPKSQRAVWEALSADRLGRWPDWIRYVRCVDRRNSILHEGVLPSRRLPDRADAVEALQVMHSLHAHLTEVLQDDPLVRHVV